MKIVHKAGQFIAENENLKEGKYVPGVGRVLHFIEVAYLLYTKRAELYTETGSKIDFEELFRKFGNRKLWTLFTVYYDLRHRGRRVRPGMSENDIVIEDKSNPIRIFVAEENTELSLNTLLEWIEDSMKKGYKPIIAVVDMYGDVTYYEMAKISLPKIIRSDSTIHLEH